MTLAIEFLLLSHHRKSAVCLKTITRKKFLTRRQMSLASSVDLPNMGRTRIEPIIKSEEDKREFRGLELANGLQVLLISDPETDKSAACLCVEVGYMSDDAELPGLAHFTEHVNLITNHLFLMTLMNIFIFS